MLLPDHFYHIYNHANGRENLFTTEENYFFFTQKLIKYIGPICDIYAYCLMPNHFHLLIRTRNISELKEYYMKYLLSTDLFIAERLEIEKLILRISAFELNADGAIQHQKYLSKQFSNLFSSYTQAFNKLYDRKGSLFLKNFKSREISTVKYLTTVIHYIHYNPVKHGLVAKLEHWKWSSYQSFLVETISNVERDRVLNVFGSKEEFLSFHKLGCPIDLSEVFD